jgi:hypothetical protein
MSKSKRFKSPYPLAGLNGAIPLYKGDLAFLRENGAVVGPGTRIDCLALCPFEGRRWPDLLQRCNFSRTAKAGINCFAGCGRQSIADDRNSFHVTQSAFLRLTHISPSVRPLER